jgi:photosystem II stability/assembly factor-like uncharacterized protein
MPSSWSSIVAGRQPASKNGTKQQRLDIGPGRDGRRLGAARAPRPKREPVPSGRSYRGMTTFKNTCTALLISATAFLGLAQVASATPVPTNFEPGSVSFVSASEGFLLGTSPCGHAPCTAVLATSDGGRTWTRVAAPGASFASTASRYPASVSQVVFANASDGWAYGNSLWATYNGARSWQRLNLGGPVFSLNSSARVAYALVGSCSPGANSCQTPILRLERSSVGSRSWQPVPGISRYGTSAIIAANGDNAWVSLAPRDHGPAMVWTTSDGGAKWHSVPDSCYQPSQAIDLAGLASPGGSVLFELCAGNPGAGQEGKSLRISNDGGSTSHLVSHLPLGGLAQGIAAVGSENVYVTAVSGASDVYSSVNGGKTWAARIFDDGGAGLTDIGFSTPSFGAAIEGQPAYGLSADRLLITDDGGATWVAVKS